MVRIVPGFEVGDGDPTGREPRLVEAFAEDLGADVEWTVTGEEDLVRLLEEGEIDLAFGGFTDTNAWVDKVGLTRSYAEVEVAETGTGVAGYGPPRTLSLGVRLTR